MLPSLQKSSTRLPSDEYLSASVSTASPPNPLPRISSRAATQPRNAAESATNRAQAHAASVLPLYIVGFLATYLTTRSRRREFAVMRCIGRKKHSIFWQVFSEELLLALLGAAIGAGVAFAIEGGYPPAAVKSA